MSLSIYNLVVYYIPPFTSSIKNRGVSALVLAVDCPIPDTGQTKCYDNDSEITCPQPGEPFYGQDANYAPCNPHSYTKLDAKGKPMPDSADYLITPWAMVKDNVTGLIWEVKTSDDSIHSQFNTYNWYDAQDVFIATLNSQNFGGYSDWRFPTVKELSSLIDSGIPYNLAKIDTDYFPNIQYSYWSSTTYVGDSSLAWYNSFLSSTFIYYDVKSNSRNYYVMAVRGGQWGSNNFIDNGDGTVIDTDTSLMWQKDTALDRACPKLFEH